MLLQLLLLLWGEVVGKSGGLTAHIVFTSV